MTAFGGAYKPESQEARALRTINQDSYDYRDQAKLLSKLTGDVSYMAQYMRNMQKGIDDANQNFVEQLTSMVNDLFVVVGGTGNTGFDFGDLKYIFQAIGALFGFDDATGIAKIFPINLFSAAWHFFSTYIIPINNFPEVINMIIDQAIATVLDVLGEVPIIGGAVQHLAQWISNFRMGIANATEILGGIFSDWTEALATGLKKIFNSLKKIVLFFTGNASEDLDELENWGKRLPIKDTLGKILDNDIPDLDAKKLTRGTLLRARLGVQDFENLAAGSDFESTDVPWTLAASHTIDSTTNKFGTKSLKLAATGTNTVSTLQGDFNTEEDEQFFVAVWVKRDAAWNAANTSGSRLVISGMPNDAPIGGIYLGANDIGVPGLWHLKKATVTVPVGTSITSLKVEIKTDTTASAGNVWLDNIIIRRIKGDDLIRDDLDAKKITKGKLLRRILGIADFENLASGSDFEAVEHPWTLAAAHTIDANTAKFGVQSLKCASNAAAQTSTLQGDFAVTEGDRYYTELYAKKDSNWNGTSTNSRFVVRGLPGNVVLDSIPLGSSNFFGTIWDKKVMRTLIPTGYTSIAFNIETGATTGNLWIDNIVVRRTKQGKDIDDGAIGTDHLGDGVVTGGKVAGLDGSKITSGTILENFIDNLSANKIVRGTLFRSRIGIKDFENIAAGSDFEGDHPWTLAANHVIDSTVNKFGKKSLKLIGSGSGTSTLQGEFATSEEDQYFVVFWAKKDAAWNSTSTNSQFRVHGLVNDVPTLIAQINLGTSDLTQLWSLQQVRFTVNAGTNITGLTFSIVSGGTAGNVWLDNIVIRRVYSSDQIQDDAVTTPKIAASAVTGAKVSTLDASKIGSGVFGTGLIPDLSAGKITSGTFAAERLADLSITAAKLADATITGAKIGPLAVAAGHIVDNAVTSGKIGPLAILAGHIVDNAVTNAKINADVDAGKITTGIFGGSRIPSLDASKIATGQFGSALIADAAITGAKIGPLAVAASHIVDNAVTSGKIGPLAVLASHIVDNAVTNAKINADVDAGKITTGIFGGSRIPSLDASKIATGQFGSAMIADAAVTGAKIGPLAIAAGHIVDNAVTSGKIGPLAVAAGHIVDNAITSGKIANGSVTSEKLSSLAVTAEKLADAAVTGVKLGPLAVAAGHIVDNAVTSGKIGPFAVVAGHIVDKAISTSKIADSAVTSTQISSAAVTTSKIANSAVTTTNLATGAVTTTNIANLAVTGEKTSGLDASKITGGAISQGLVTNLTSDLNSMNTKTQNTIDAVWNGLNGSGNTPGTLYGSTSYTQSSLYGGLTAASYANMNNSNAAETAQTGLNSGYVQANVGSVQYINHIVIGYDYLNTLGDHSWGVAYTGGATIEGSTNGSTWTTIGTTPSYASTGSSNGLFPINIGANYQYIRITKAGYFCLTEFQVWVGGSVGGTSATGKLPADVQVVAATVKESAAAANGKAVEADNLATVTSAQGGLVISPDFEEPTVRRFVDYSKAGLFTGEYSTTRAVTGSYSYKITMTAAGTSSDNGGVSLNPYKSEWDVVWFNVAPGQVYNYDFVYYLATTSSKPVALSGGYRLLNGTVTSNSGPNIALPSTTKNTWLRATGSFTVPDLVPATTGSPPLQMFLTFGFTAGAVGAAGDAVYLDRCLIWR